MLYFVISGIQYQKYQKDLDADCHALVRRNIQKFHRIILVQHKLLAEYIQKYRLIVFQKGRYLQVNRRLGKVLAVEQNVIIPPISIPFPAIQLNHYIFFFIIQRPDEFERREQLRRSKPDPRHAFA